MVSGGYSYISDEGEIFYSQSFSTNSWSVGGDNFDGVGTGELDAIAFARQPNQGPHDESCALTAELRSRVVRSLVPTRKSDGEVAGTCLNRAISVSRPGSRATRKWHNSANTASLARCMRY